MRSKTVFKPPLGLGIGPGLDTVVPDTAKEVPVIVVEDPPAPALQAIYFDVPIQMLCAIASIIVSKTTSYKQMRKVSDWERNFLPPTGTGPAELSLNVPGTVHFLQHICQAVQAYAWMHIHVL
eukprot:8994-Heterococcus_DN1.PRE.1